MIHNHFNQAITISKIAQTIGINRSHLSELFHRETGTTIQQYLIRYRINRAREYITHTDDPISEIALSVGYSTYYSFEKRFRETVGMSPTAFRSAHRIETQKFFFEKEGNSINPAGGITE